MKLIFLFIFVCFSCSFVCQYSYCKFSPDQYFEKSKKRLLVQTIRGRIVHSYIHFKKYLFFHTTNISQTFLGANFKPHRNSWKRQKASEVFSVQPTVTVFYALLHIMGVQYFEGCGVAKLQRSINYQGGILRNEMRLNESWYLKILILNNYGMLFMGISTHESL